MDVVSSSIFFLSKLLCPVLGYNCGLGEEGLESEKLPLCICERQQVRLAMYILQYMPKNSTFSFYEASAKCGSMPNVTHFSCLVKILQ